MTHGPTTGLATKRPVPFHWERPADWLPLPDVQPGEDKIVALLAVYPGDNFFAFMAVGDYQIDWGDGQAAETVSTATQVNKNLAWASYPEGTLTSRGYRQAIITITPQASSVLQRIDFYRKHNQSGLPDNVVNRMLDLKMSLPNCTMFTLGSNLTSNTYYGMLEHIEWVGGSPLAVESDYLFANCRALRRLDGSDWCHHMVTLSRTFNNCYELTEVPSLDTAACSNFSQIFGACRSLSTAPDLDTSWAIYISNFFLQCSSLRVVPPYDFSRAVYANDTFNSCGVMELPMFDFGNVRNASSMFNGCFLHALPAYDLSKAVNINRLFYAGWIVRPPMFDLREAVRCDEVFYAANGVEEIPAWNLRDAATLYRFASCSKMHTCSIIATGGGVANITEMFTTAGSLRALPSIDASAVTICSSPFPNCNAIESSGVYGLRLSHTYPAAYLLAADLDAIYTNLGTALYSGVTITVTGNPGTSGDDPTIATNKGWTVTS